MHSMMKQRCLLTKFYCTANKMTHETLSLQIKVMEGLPNLELRINEVSEYASSSIQSTVKTTLTIHLK